MVNQPVYPNRDYMADVQIDMDDDYTDPENLPHTYSDPFNPFKQSECKQPRLLPHPTQVEPLWSDVANELDQFSVIDFYWNRAIQTCLESFLLLLSAVTSTTLLLKPVASALLSWEGHRLLWQAPNMVPAWTGPSFTSARQTYTGNIYQDIWLKHWPVRRNWFPTQDPAMAHKFTDKKEKKEQMKKKT